jgi:hypothetical protein
MDIAPRVAEIMAAEMRMDHSWIAEQVIAFNEVAAIYLVKGS